MASGLAQKSGIILDHAEFLRRQAEARRGETRAIAAPAIGRKLQHEKEQRARNKAKHARNTKIGVMAGGALLGAGAGAIIAPTVGAAVIPGIHGIAGTAGGMTAAQGAVAGAVAGSSIAGGIMEGDTGAVSRGVQDVQKITDKFATFSNNNTLSALAAQLRSNAGTSAGSTAGAIGGPRSFLDTNSTMSNLSRIHSEPIPPVDREDFDFPEK